jgi:hypothetical protein
MRCILADTLLDNPEDADESVQGLGQAGGVSSWT